MNLALMSAEGDATLTLTPRQEAEDPVPRSPFWTSFYAGLAAPTALYAATPNYAAFARLPSPAISFAMTGALLSQQGGLRLQGRKIG